MFGFSPYRRHTVTRFALAFTLAGCMLASGTVVRAQHPTASPVTITYWNQWVDPVAKSAVLKVIALFEKAHPGIHVHEVDIGSDQKILTAITGGKPPDAAVLWTPADVGEWAARGAIQNIGPLSKARHADLSDYSKPALAMSSFKGQLYGLPVELDENALFVVPAFFHAAGLNRYPRTMGEVAADALKLTKKDAAGRITQLGLGPSFADAGGWMLQYLAPYFNGRWYDPAHHTVTPDNPGVLQALQWQKALVDKIGVQAYANFTQAKARNPIGDLFVDGRTAMAIEGEWGCTLIHAYNPKLDWKVLPPPYADGHPQWQNSTSLGGAVDVIPTGAPHPNEAFQFIQFMGSTQAQVILNRTWGNVPTVKSAASILGHGCLKTFIDLAFAPRAFPWPVLPVASQYQTAVGTAEDAVMRGKDTPQHAMTQVRQTIQAALAAAH